MLIWRPILRDKCTLVELRTALTLDDLMDINEALDMQDALERDAADRAQPKGRKR